MANNQEIKNIFQPFVQQFNLSDKSERFFILLDQYQINQITKAKLYSETSKMSGLPISEYYKITSSLNQLLKQLSLQPTGLANGSAVTDVPLEEKRQDIIFHELLDYIKSLKLKKGLDRRVFNLFISFFKGIRDELETRETLVKDIERGGLAFNAEKSEETVVKFKAIISEIQAGRFKSDELVDWFKNHYETVLAAKPITSGAEDLPLHEDKIKADPYRPEIKADHDMSQPLPQHIALHQKEVTAPIEIAAPLTVKQPMIAPVSAPDAKATEDKPAAVTVLPKVPTSEGIRHTGDIGSVAMKPIRADLPVRKVPEELKQMLAADLGENLPLTEIKEAKPSQPKASLFKRMFGKKERPEMSSPMADVTPKTPAPVSKLPTPAVPTQRPRMDDVTHASPKLFGPIEELQSLSLADFRRLSKDPAVACKKLKDKLELLAHESWEKRAEGLAALAKSELYKQYSDIMNASVIEGRSFVDVIAAKNTLSEPEFRALMQLNKELRS